MNSDFKYQGIGSVSPNPSYKWLKPKESYTLNEAKKKTINQVLPYHLKTAVSHTALKQTSSTDKKEKKKAHRIPFLELTGARPVCLLGHLNKAPSRIR